MTKVVFIVADDLGLDISVNQGIVYALKNKLVSGASIMVNGEQFSHAVELIANLENPNIGIHFVLVGEKGLYLKELPKNYQIFFLKYIFGLIKIEDIEKELRAQLNKLLKAGIKPQFINSHQHLHLLPKVTDAVIKLAKENNIKYIRTVGEPFSLKGGLLRSLESIFLALLSKLSRNKIKKAGLSTNDIFIGFLHAGNLQKKDVSLAYEISNENPNKIIELGAHPGFESTELKEKYKNWGNYNWQKELDLLQKK